MALSKQGIEVVNDALSLSPLEMCRVAGNILLQLQMNYEQIEAFWNELSPEIQGELDCWIAEHSG